MIVYIVINPELGWDCVCGVYTSEEVARKEYPDEDSYIIHEEILDRTKIEDYIYEEDEPIEIIKEPEDETGGKLAELLSKGEKFSISREGYRNVNLQKLKESIEENGYTMVEKGILRLFYEKRL